MAQSNRRKPDTARRKRVDEILDRGVVVKMLPSREAVVEMLAAHKPARIYIGADPTGAELHLSHAKNYMLLEEFRQLGHHVIVLFGDFTARIGDPTDQASARTQLSEEAVRANVAKWLDQIRPIISFDDEHNPAHIEFNSKWLAPLTFTDLIDLASQMTVQRMLERSMFERRLANQEPIHVHEFLYPLMQGYDSVAMNIDIELCGADQEFNALVGRTLCSRLQGREKGIIEVNLMENPLTGELMSKSSGRGVFLSGGPRDLYGQVMALPDEMTKVCFVNVTRVPLREIERIVAGHPRDAKATLARTLVEKFHGLEAADMAEESFQQQFVERLLPTDAPVVTAPARSVSAVDLALLGAGERFSTRSSVRRVIQQGGMRVSSVRIDDPHQLIEIPPEGVDVRLGKLVWFRVKPSESQ